jgi:large subunit ribosomal protein L15
MNSFKLNELKPRNGIDRKALGRGIGSGCGKTCSYGHKGGKARSGRGAVSWFEGGQMPIYRRLPKRGFVSQRDRTSVVCINLVVLQRLCEAQVLSAGQEVNIETLKRIGIARNSASTLRILAKGELRTSLHIFAAYASAAAIRCVEAVGGKVEFK